VEFKVELDVFSGPLDLLLYLVKKHEVDVADVPLAAVAAEFVAYLDVLEALALDEVGEFVELASVLLEIKARALVPRPEEAEEPVDLPREDLVRRLLEYKQYRDAASMLEDRARRQESRFPRHHGDEPAAAAGTAPAPIADVHVWDLVGAMSRVLARREKRRPRQIVHDDTPIERHIERVESLVNEQGRVAFSALFDDDMDRPRVIGTFLAVLELVRRGRLAASQDLPFDEIWLEPNRSGRGRAQPEEPA
jgi:segregation and condensation protein A